jgi:hypothetical protein
LQSDLTEAIRSRNEVVAATVRMALTAVRSSEASGTAAHQLSDEEVLAVLGKEAKKRREAATAFADAGRAAQAERELAELAVLEGYLPQQISDDDLTSLVAAAIAELATAGVSGMAAMGRVMKTVQPQLAGRAEGGRIAAEVKRQLSAG